MTAYSAAYSAANSAANSAARSLLKKVGDAVKKAGLEAPVLACVSGGADSVAMLHAFVRLGIPCEAVNCNFHLRGNESDRDSYFVAKLCGRLGIKLHSLDFNASEHSSIHHVSIEMACRELRYEAFRELREKENFSRMAVAHNADDNVETFFLNLLRGTGLKGLCGMGEDNGEILRPLISVSRQEILEFLHSIGENYVTDSSNLDVKYLRNFLRLDVLPLLEARWPGLRKSLATTMANLRSSEEVCRQALTSLTDETDFLPLKILDDSPSVNALLHHCFSGKGVSPSQLREMEHTRRPGAQWKLPSGIIRLQPDGFRYFADSMPATPDFEVSAFQLTEELYREIAGNRDDNVAYFPGSLERYEWTVLKKGMRFHPCGMKGSKKIADLLRDVHMPAPSRNSYPLLRDRETGNVLWIPGIRRSRHSLVSPEDKTITKIELIKTQPKLR